MSFSSEGSRHKPPYHMTLSYCNPPETKVLLLFTGWSFFYYISISIQFGLNYMQEEEAFASSCIFPAVINLNAKQNFCWTSVSAF